ncbi:hypothetical protein Cgig2_018931 [Carnegiea gigantea]|uniref:Expansin-like EG45 domain-containing protein n=1 Tax=Carnegiea gigantea TaxID=171969 RepID=A0A9Q1K4T6_9CARY|nr:hypothetical protein Cgig2_018931 [Carnegiea gigantea]
MWLFGKNTTCAYAYLEHCYALGLVWFFARPYAYSPDKSDSNWKLPSPLGMVTLRETVVMVWACELGRWRMRVWVLSRRAAVQGSSDIGESDPIQEWTKGAGHATWSMLRQKVCSDSAVTVVVTDECPGCSGTHFDLSGAALVTWPSMVRAASLGTEASPHCLPKYPGMKIAFHVNEGSSAYWLSLLVVFEGGDGDIGALYIKQASAIEGYRWHIHGEQIGTLRSRTLQGTLFN